MATGALVSPYPLAGHEPQLGIHELPVGPTHGAGLGAGRGRYNSRAVGFDASLGATLLEVRAVLDADVLAGEGRGFPVHVVGTGRIRALVARHAAPHRGRLKVVAAVRAPLDRCARDPVAPLLTLTPADAPRRIVLA